MNSHKKFSVVFGLLLVTGLVLAACQPQVIEVEKEVVVTQVVREEVEVPVEVEKIVEVEVEVEKVVEKIVEVEVEAAPVEEVAAGGECCDAYRIGIYEDPITLNPWSYYGPDNSVWTGYAISNVMGSVFGYSSQRLDWIPGLAKGLPASAVEDGDAWTVTAELLDNQTWSDGEAVDANDVAFTINTALDLDLTGNWVSAVKPDILTSVEALDDHSLKYTFNAQPGLSQWQFGVAFAPVLPEHFWGPVVAEASAFIADASKPEADKPEDCEADDADADACAAWASYDEAFQNAREFLYKADATGQPFAGAYVTSKLEPGAFVQKDPNPNYPGAGTVETLYDGGGWVSEHADGTVQEAYGGETGDATLTVAEGPFAPNMVMSIYGSQDAAFLAMIDGDIDYVINPLGIARGLREKAAAGGEGLKTYTNQDNGLFYLAFNFRKPPMNDPAFRQAADIIIDKEFVVDSVLQGSVMPMYSVVPSGNGFWHNADVAKPYVGMSRNDRVEMAKEVLKEAGYAWSKDPEWSDDLQDVVPGEGMTMPDGSDVPALTILGPGPAYDPVRATFNQWISEYMREMGIPVESELTGFNTILDPVFVECTFDMYILGWGLTAYADHPVDFFHSRNDCPGGYNTPGIKDDELDALLEEFEQSTDLDSARDLNHQVQALLAEKRPYIPLFQRQAYDVIRDNVVLPYTEIMGGLAEAQGFQSSAQPLTR